MARVTGALLSIEAFGTFAGSLLFARYPKGSVARRQRVARAPYDPKTPTQIFNRDFFGTVVGIWKMLDSGVREELDVLGNSVSYSGFNWYVKKYRERRPTECGNTRCGFSELGDLTLST
jgi:hypothetical protein